MLGDPDDTRARFERVVALMEGFESPFGLELPSTVHWVLDREAPASPEEPIARTHAWNERKKRFSRRQIRLTADVLFEKGWSGRPPAMTPGSGERDLG